MQTLTLFERRILLLGHVIVYHAVHEFREEFIQHDSHFAHGSEDDPVAAFFNGCADTGGDGFGRHQLAFVKRGFTLGAAIL